MLNQFLSNFRNPRIITAFLYDAVVAASSFYLALALKFETLDFTKFPVPNLLEFILISEFLFIFSFIVNGLYQGVWRFSSTHDLMRVIRASAIGIIFTLVACFYLNRLEAVPRSFFPIQFLLLVVGLGGGRFIYRLLKDKKIAFKFQSDAEKSSKKVLIVGAGRAGEKLLRDINSTPDLNLRVVGFVDDDKYKRNALIHNVRIFGNTLLIAQIVNDYNVDLVFIAIPSASGEDIKRIIKKCEQTKAEIKILPRMDHLLSPQVELSLLRNIKIEDLLGREQVQLDNAHLSSMISNKTILVTGAGGSIGSEICFQIAKFGPKLLIMADFCELFLYELEMKFKELHPSIDFCPRIIDVKNVEKIDQLFSYFLPQIVFHAAAYKHVPMMEYNPIEAIDTNINGTMIVADASMRHKAERFILISTDKAVNPTNVMGASKRIAEMVVTNFSNISTFTKFVSVRFGNVLGSSGSVIPLFTKQIEERKDITVTHPDITRFFMSIPEASQLVLQAGSMGNGGETFVLDMGEPVKIVDLAKEMVRLAGLTLDKDIKIVFSGLRPGEKLYEELFSDQEQYEFTHHGKIRKALMRSLADDFDKNLKTLLALKTTDSDIVLYMIKNLIPEFTHSRLLSEEQSYSNH